MTDKKMEEPTQYRLIGPTENGDVSDLLTGKNTKDAKYRLQALIAEWLRMENLVVLTGAGTSVTCGGKTIAGLERDVLEVVKATKNLPASVVNIVNDRQAALGTSVNFEDWLSFLVNAHYLGTAPNSLFEGLMWKGNVDPEQSDLPTLINRIHKVVFAECALMLPELRCLSTNDSDIAPHLSFLAKLVARDSNLGRTHLFTLNYDTLFEQALESLGIQYFDGFSGRANARFDPSVYGLDVYYPGEVAEGRVRRFDKMMHLYKLHGSIHWQLGQGGLVARHPDLRHFENFIALEKPAEKAAMIDELDKNIPFVGILPTANKFVQTLTMPFAHLFRSFQIRLSIPQTFLLVLGYGFGDSHVNSLIETGLMNPSLVMLVVEPDPQSGTINRIQRYKELGKRAFVLSPTEAAFEDANFTIATFDDFARSVMPDVQWLSDFLRLRRFENQIATYKSAEDKD